MRRMASMMGMSGALMALSMMGMKIEPVTDRQRESDGKRRPAYSGRRYGRSKYMPHSGAKEAARHAGKPDGKMHLTPHEAWAARRARWAY